MLTNVFCFLKNSLSLCVNVIIRGFCLFNKNLFFTINHLFDCIGFHQNENNFISQSFNIGYGVCVILTWKMLKDPLHYIFLINSCLLVV
jgi:hypothetical protein